MLFFFCLTKAVLLMWSYKIIHCLVHPQFCIKICTFRKTKKNLSRQNDIAPCSGNRVTLFPSLVTFCPLSDRASWLHSHNPVIPVNGSLTGGCHNESTHAFFFFKLKTFEDLWYTRSCCWVTFPHLRWHDVPAWVGLSWARALEETSAVRVLNQLPPGGSTCQKMHPCWGW